MLVESTMVKRRTASRWRKHYNWLAEYCQSIGSRKFVVGETFAYVFIFYRSWMMAHSVFQTMVRMGLKNLDNYPDGHVVVIGYLTTVMYYSYGQRPAPSVDGWSMVWMLYDSHMITGDEYGPNFLTFILTVEGKPRNRTQTRCMRGKDVTTRPRRWSKMYIQVFRHKNVW